jgi:hypothetical protein
VVVLAPPIDGEQASLVALLSDGAAWSTSALALALGASQRTVQRALAELEAAGRVRAIGRRGRAAGWRRRWRDSRRSCYSPLRCRLPRVHPGADSGAPTRSKHGEHQSRTGPRPRRNPAEIVREYGPFPGATRSPASPTTAATSGPPRAPSCIAFDPRAASHAHARRACDAGTAFDGTHLYQIAETRIDKIDPGHRQGAGVDPGARQRQRLGPDLGRGQPVGRPVPRPQDPPDRPGHRRHPRTIESNRFVTGVTWVDGELWHGTWEGDDSDIRRIDPQSGAVLERLQMPAGTGVSGLESDGADLFYCGGGGSGKVRAVRRPKAARA